MTDWQQTLAGTVEGFERQFDHLKRKLGSAQDIFIVPYRSYGSRDHLLVRGRVLSGGRVPHGRAEDSIWQNLLNIYRRLESDEVVGACIRAVAGDVQVEAISDDEGYFDIWLPFDGKRRLEGWLEVSLELCPASGSYEKVMPVQAEVLLPSERARFGVISDIDDTVLQTYATALLRMARLTLLGNAQTRLPFPGVAAFYRALQSAPGTDNPIFYVSSSPWNLYDLLVDFFDVQGIPRGPMFLRDWGISSEEWLPTQHAGHKLKAIEDLFEFYGDLSFILIGDSGQHDPEIYAEVVRRYGQRVLAVYIRDVNEDDRRDAEVVALAKEVTAAGSTLVLADDTVAMAQHAARNRWIEPDAIDSIAQELHASEEEESIVDESWDETNAS